MLELNKITKIYESSSLKKTALKNVSLAFSEAELVAILGPSGSGKSTLLNIIGLLDQASAGTITLNGISLSTLDEKTKNYYRSQKIGFVFQNYNLLENQTVKFNLDLPLELSKKVNKEFIFYLEELGLKPLLNKKVKDLSGGEKQRVALARALVNNPDIILADEPTGALDLKNSLIIMEHLKTISKKKLVILVTHNEELANKFADRIIKIQDGLIIFDSKPYYSLNASKPILKLRNKKITWKTALRLALSNLKTKKGRNFITSLALSIGITGIAIILAITNGLNNYVASFLQEMLYPIEINHEEFVSSDISEGILTTGVLESKENDLQAFETFLQTGVLNKFLTEIKYFYDLEIPIYDYNMKLIDKSFLGELPTNLKDYEVVAGRLPTNYAEVVLILDENGQIPLELAHPSSKTYDELLNITYTLVPSSKFYTIENGFFQKNETLAYLKQLLNEGLTLKVVGVFKSKTIFNSYALGYQKELINFLVEQNEESLTAKKQLASPDINVFTQEKFASEQNASYEENLKLIGLKTKVPQKIALYPKDYQSKLKIIEILDNYIEKHELIYHDYIGELAQNMTSIVKGVSYLLLIFVAISLLVSLIMIINITYISVLERTKEIGILKALGAMKSDIKRLFKTENLFIGIIAILISLISYLCLSSLINYFVLLKLEVESFSYLTFSNYILLSAIALFIPVFAAIFPALKAFKMEVVASLKTE